MTIDVESGCRLRLITHDEFSKNEWKKVGGSIFLRLAGSEEIIGVLQRSGAIEISITAESF